MSTPHVTKQNFHSMSEGKETLLNEVRPKSSEYGSVASEQQTLSPTTTSHPDDVTMATSRNTSPMTSSVPGTQQDLNDIYHQLGRGLTQYLYWAATGLIAYSDYAELTIISVVLPSVRCEWNLSTLFETILTMSVFVSYAIFAVIFGRISDIYGRKIVLTTSVIVLIFAAGASAAAPNKWVFLVGRIVTGACVGINLSTIACYATELAESKLRMVGMTIFITSSMVGYIAVNALGLALLNIVGWRWFIVIASLPVAPALALLIYLPESPRYYCVSGQQNKAHETLRFMARLNDASLPENLNVVCKESEDLGSYRMIFSKTYRNSTICLAVIYFMDIFLEFGLIIFLPLYFSSGVCIIEGGGPPPHVCTPLSTEDLANLTLTSLFALVGVILSIMSSHKLGRLGPIRVTSILQTVGLALLFICFNKTFSTVVIMATKAVQSFINTSIWVMLPESFPTDVRSTAVGFVNGAGKFGGVIGTGCVQFFFYMDPNIVLGLFLATSVIGAIGTFILNKETKDILLI